MLISLRHATPEDEDFLYQVYASTREDEMALVPWTMEQKEAFLHMQFNAQRQSYRMQFPAAEYDVILCNNNPVGRLIVDRADEEIRLMDIALLAPYRNQGIGSGLIRDLQRQAISTQKPLRLHVESFNPAARLYARLGFREIGEIGIYHELEWRT
jgi:ribosomal protein S18 acetylase RimI-like enzyme